MAGDRYVVVGLARPRAEWFRALAQWAHAASIPVELVKCVSVEELSARLASARTFSAALIDAGAPGLDRDLLDLARRRGCAVLVVEDARVRREWQLLGAHAVLSQGFTQQNLVDTLRAHAALIPRTATRSMPATTQTETTSPVGAVAALCGGGGTGTSTCAIALAQGISRGLVEHRQNQHPLRSARNHASATASPGPPVLLADLALHADQALLHDARDVVPGLQELVEAFRAGVPGSDDLLSYVFDVDERGYQLLLGLRRARSWSAIRPRAFEAALDAVRQRWRTVVCDIGSDFEGEQETGSADVEERHLLSRTAALRADAVFAVGLPGVKGIHTLVRVVADLLALGVAPARIVPVVNRSPRGPRARAEMAHALGVLVPGRSASDDILPPTRLSGAGAGDGPRGAGVWSPIFLPERGVDDLLRDGVRLPSVLTEPLAGAFVAVVGHDHDQPGASTREATTGELVTPGSLGHWSEGDEVAPRRGDEIAPRRPDNGPEAASGWR